MASGFGLNGGMLAQQCDSRFYPACPSRCYPFWQELLSCYVINSADGVEGKQKCLGATEDYYECLHHGKEQSRMKAMEIAYRKSEAQQAKESAEKSQSQSSS
ncbi:hypothetical protein KEM55_002883 [Ascosphaera atra]|nr:hypothetical protein KEM55_002883 [Ascosphaera atra]